MNTIIEKPIYFDNNTLTMLIDLIESGGQVERRHIERGVQSADLIAIMFDHEKIVTTATLKNPLVSYRESLFREAGVDYEYEKYEKELGYIVTDPQYEGKKLCQRLLIDFTACIKEQNIFSTTRKPSMAHVLSKFGFNNIGKVYKQDLRLLVYNGNE